MLDLSSVILGPFASQLLADYGAEVIKVEPPEGDITRRMGPAAEPGMAALYLGVNRSKKSLTLDIKSTEGRAALMRLIEGADVLMHNIRPQKLKSLGLDRETVLARNPRIVYAALYGFGTGGPYEGRPAYDDIIQGLAGYAGFMQMQYGTAGYLPTAVGDKVTAMFAVQAILAGLVERERTGRGTFAVIPMFESLVCFGLAEHMFGRHFHPPRGGMGYPRMLMPQRHPYATKDGHLCIMPYTDSHWQTFFKVAGVPEVFDDPRFNEVGARTRNIDALYDLVGIELLKKTTAEWLDLLERHDVPACIVRMPDDLDQDPHLKAVGHFHHLSDPAMGTIVLSSNPVTFDGRRGEVRMPPRLGQDSAQVLHDFGFSAEEIEHLVGQADRVSAQRAERREATASSSP